MYTLIRWTAVFAILGVLSVASYWLASSRTLAGDVLRLEAELSPVGLDGLQGGDGDWRLLDEGAERISVEVEDVALPLGTMLAVEACGTSLGTIELVDVDPGLAVVLGGDLNIDERDDANDDGIPDALAPTCDVGDTVTVKHLGATILEGTFALDD